MSKHLMGRHPILGSVALLVALGVAGAAAAQEDAAGSPARLELAELSKQKRAAYKVDEEQRDAALREVAAGYGRVAEDAARPLAERCEAAFRAGEILRARQDMEAAHAWFTSAFTWGEAGQSLGEEREFAARAWLEIAHMHRRDGDVEAARAIYEALPERFDDQRRTAAHATTWLGKLQIEAEDLDAAGDTLLGFASAFPEYPEEAVRNADLLAVAYLEAGRLQDARDVVARIEAAMQGHLDGEGRLAEAVRATLEGMRARERLAPDAG